ATLEQHEWLIIKIYDTGSGIPPDNRERIFNLNFSTKGRGTNSGVGLYAVQPIVSRVGGKIRIASATRDEHGRLVTWHSGVDNPIPWTAPGTLFQIELPIRKEA